MAWKYGLKIEGMKKEYFNSRANTNWIIIFETNVKYFVANYLISSQLYPFIPPPIISQSLVSLYIYLEQLSNQIVK